MPTDNEGRELVDIDQFKSLANGGRRPLLRPGLPPTKQRLLLEEWSHLSPHVEVLAPTARPLAEPRSVRVDAVQLRCFPEVGEGRQPAPRAPVAFWAVHVFVDIGSAVTAGLVVAGLLGAVHWTAKSRSRSSC